MKRYFLTAAALLFGFSFIASKAMAIGPVDLQVAYAYNDNVNAPLPNPWDGSPGVDFLGMAGAQGYDAGALMIHNNSKYNETVTGVVVRIGDRQTGTGSGTSGCKYVGGSCDPWAISPTSPLVIPPNGDAILTQTNGYYDFDTSDLNPGTCAKPSTLKPRITVTTFASNITTAFVFEDKTQVLNTGGVDVGNKANSCYALEGHDWVPTPRINVYHP